MSSVSEAAMLPPRVLVVGANGMIGRALVGALRHEGATVGRVARSGPQCTFHLDFSDMQSPATLALRLRGWDVVVNAVGIGPACPGHLQIHRDAPSMLFEACARAQVKNVVQVSAQGDARSGSFIASKHEADAALLGGSLPASIIRPSLVLGQGGQSTRLLLFLSRLPLLFLPPACNGELEPLLADELAAWLARGIVTRSLLQGVVELGGPERMSLVELLLRLRRVQGKLGKQRVLPLPEAGMSMALRLMGAAGSPLGGGQTVSLLQHGSVCNAPDAVRLHTGPEGLSLGERSASCLQPS